MSIGTRLAQRRRRAGTGNSYDVIARRNVAVGLRRLHRHARR